MPEDNLPTPSATDATPHVRRKRYSGKNPRRFEEKYKEHGSDAATLAKVIAAGKTPAGTHRPIMVPEILAILAPQPGETAADCTLGYGGHTQELLARLAPGGRVIGLDTDPIELPKTVERLRALSFGEEVFTAHRTNYAGLPQVLSGLGIESVDMILADLGVSSMQIDDPTRGFSVKLDGPLDMRMNPQRGVPASVLLAKTKTDALATILELNADEPNAIKLSLTLAEQQFATTRQLAEAIRDTLPYLGKDDADLTVRRVFQALRIAVNDEFSALDMFLRNLPFCLKPGGRVAILTFHSGEDRRVKKAFDAGYYDGTYGDIAKSVGRPTPEEQHSNPRSAPAKLRWAVRAKAT